MSKYNRRVCFSFSFLFSGYDLRGSLACIGLLLYINETHTILCGSFKILFCQKKVQISKPISYSLLPSSCPFPTSHLYLGLAKCRKNGISEYAGLCPCAEPPPRMLCLSEWKRDDWIFDSYIISLQIPKGGVVLLLCDSQFNVPARGERERERGGEEY
jgi:hypothetical protein